MASFGTVIFLGNDLPPAYCVQPLIWARPTEYSDAPNDPGAGKLEVVLWREFAPIEDEAGLAADRFSRNALPIVELIKRSGISTLAEIADALNARGLRSARDGKRHVSAIENLLARSKS